MSIGTGRNEQFAVSLIPSPNKDMCGGRKAIEQENSCRKEESFGGTFT